MPTQTLTLKLPFYRLNQCKAEEFEVFTQTFTDLANELLEIPKKVRSKLTSKDFNHIKEVGSMWCNQLIRNCNAKTRVKKFKKLPPEVNNQGFRIEKSGELFTIKFNTQRGRKRSLPLEIHHASHAKRLQGVLDGTVKLGSLKLWKSRKGIWYAIISVTMEVPETKVVNGWIGVDRGQNNIAVAAIPNGFGRFWKAGPIKHLRKRHQRIRKHLQSAGKHKAVKNYEHKESRIMAHANHIIAKQIVQFAKDYQMGIRLENLSGIRQGSRQRKKTKSDASKNRDFWAFYQLGQFIQYLANLEGIPVEFILPAYTSKSSWKTGVIGKRNRHDFYDKTIDYHCNADFNASQNIGQWVGLNCSLNL